MTEDEYVHKCLVLLYHRFLYYVLGTTKIGDQEYDAIEREVSEYEGDNPYGIHPDSPVGKVGSDQITTYPRSIIHACKHMGGFKDVMARGGYKFIK